MDKLTEKSPKSAAERKHLQRQCERYWRKENERLKLLRRNQKAKVSASALNEKRTKDRARWGSTKKERGESKKQCCFTVKS